MNKYILDSCGNPVVCNDLRKWAQWFENADRSVDKTDVKVGDREFRVSTVFLGLNYSYGGEEPKLFETMVFEWKGDDLNMSELSCDRYETRAEAQAGHGATILKVLSGEIA